MLKHVHAIGLDTPMCRYRRISRTLLSFRQSVTGENESKRLLWAVTVPANVQESPADARVTRDCSACMKAPMVEI